MDAFMGSVRVAFSSEPRFVLVFVLYFMLIGGQQIEKYIKRNTSFSEANIEHVVHNMKSDCTLQCRRYSFAGNHTRWSSHDRLLVL